MTYEVNGKQYVVTVDDGHGSMRVGWGTWKCCYGICAVLEVSGIK